MKIAREKDEHIRKLKKSYAYSSRSSEFHAEKESLRINYYYQPTPRRTRRESHPTETRVDLPYFYGKENVEVYLDCEMKVQQLLPATM